MTDVWKKIELPSVTMKKQNLWNDMQSLYNDSYNSLTGVVATVGTIVTYKGQLPESVDETKLTNMVVALNRNIITLRNELNVIYQKQNSTQNTELDIMDVNMECIQIAADYNEWGVRFSTLCGQPLGDIISYIEQ